MGTAGERRSGNVEQLSSEISEYLGPARGEMNIVLDANSAPPRTVNPRFDRHNSALAERGLDGLGQTGGFVNLESQSVTEAVPNCGAVATVLNVAPSETVGILPLHACTYGLGSDSVGVLHDIVNRA